MKGTSTQPHYGTGCILAPNGGMFRRAGQKSSNVSGSQFWQHSNKPVELWSAEVIEQKAEYLHLNPVTAGFVTEAWHWRYSSAIDYSGGKGLIEIDYL